MKFVFDFDGVMTDQTEEATRVKEIFIQKLKDGCGFEGGRVDAMLEQAFSELKRTPQAHGWIHKGRISAYANEDLFMENMGLANCLKKFADDGGNDFSKARENLKNTDTPNFQTLSLTSYEQMVQETKQDKMKPVDPKMAPLFRKILDAGHAITVVSNSSTSRIIDLLNKEGLEPADFETDPTATFRVRGDARKFDLGDEPHTFTVDTYTVETSRPNFEKIIREEKPNVAIGDVFTLDLSVPIHLARLEPETFGGMHVILREQRYTPDWSKNFMLTSKEENANLHVINDLDRIAEIALN